MSPRTFLWVVGVAVLFWVEAAPLVAAEPLFVPNPPTHAEGIARCRYLSNGSEAVTISSDKTVRVWNLSTRRVTTTIRLPAGPGMEGNPYALDVSPDDKLVAVGGLGVGSKATDRGPVYLISLKSGKIEKVLHGHTDYVYGVAFSSNGQMLASVSEDNTARVWDLKKGGEPRVLKGHTDIVYGVAFSPDGESVATASLDKTGKVWDVATGRELATLKGHTDKVRCVAWTPDGKRIVTGGWDDSVRVWTPRGEAIRAINPGDQPAYSVQVTADSKQVVVVTGLRLGSAGPFRCQNFVLGSGQEVARTEEIRGSLNDVTLAPDGKEIAVSGGLSGQTHLYTLGRGRLTLRGALAPATFTIRTVGWGGNSNALYWGGSLADSPDPNKLAERKLTYRFDVAQLEFRTDPTGFDVSLRNRRTVDDKTGLGVSEDERSVNYWDRGIKKPAFAIQKPDVIRSVPSLSPDNSLGVLGSEDGGWVFVTASGQLSHRLTGHSGAIVDAVFNSDGKYILTGSGDRTVRVWKVGSERPLLSLYAVDGEWVAWTPEGYYAASAGGEKLVGWLVNNKPDENPTFHPAERFHDSLYRPDVIKRLLEFGSVDEALKAADKARGQQSNKLDVKKVEPPKVKFVGDLTVGNDGKVTVSVEATSPTGDGITSLTLLVNGGRTLGTSAEKPKTGTRATERAEWADVQLDPGRNAIKVFAKTERSEGAEEVWLEFQGKRNNAKKPTLHLLSVAIDDYPQDLPEADRLKTLFESVNGAKGVEEAFSKHVGGSSSPYAKARVVSVRGKDASRKQVLDEIGAFAADVTSDRDVAIVYLSGHGVLVDANGNLTVTDGESRGAKGESWVFCTHDFLKSKPTSTGITDDELCAQLRKIRASRVLLVIDACHSGGINGAVTRKAGQESNGFDVLCACQKDQLSFEQQGDNAPLFTNLVIRGLTNNLKEYPGPLYEKFPDLNGEGVAFTLLQSGVGYVMNKRGDGQKMVYLPANRGEYLLTTPRR